MPSTKCYVFCTTNVSRIQIWSPWDKYMREFDVELIYNSVVFVYVCMYILKLIYVWETHSAAVKIRKKCD